VNQFHRRRGQWRGKVRRRRKESETRRKGDRRVGWGRVSGGNQGISSRRRKALRGSKGREEGAKTRIRVDFGVRCYENLRFIKPSKEGERKETAKKREINFGKLTK